MQRYVITQIHILLTSFKGIQIINTGMVSTNSENSTVILIAWLNLVFPFFPGTYTIQKLKTSINKVWLGFFSTNN